MHSRRGYIWALVAVGLSLTAVGCSGEESTPETVAATATPSEESLDSTTEESETAELAGLEQTWELASADEQSEICQARADLSDEEVVDSYNQNTEGQEISDEALLGFWDDVCAGLEIDEPDAGPEVFLVGESLERPTATIVVNVLEERESIATPNGFDSNTLTPTDGERLWFADITWTNNLPEAVSKECHGPYSMDLTAYDVQGREMMMVEQPGFIEGQNCSTGLMQGQTGTWLTAFRGLDEEFGWLVFDDYNGEPAVVVLDPDLDLSYEDEP